MCHPVTGLLHLEVCPPGALRLQRLSRFIFLYKAGNILPPHLSFSISLTVSLPDSVSVTLFVSLSVSVFVHIHIVEISNKSSIFTSNLLSFFLAFKTICFSLWVWMFCLCVCMNAHRQAWCLPTSKEGVRSSRCGITDGTMWVMGTEPRSSARATSTLNCWVNSLAPDMMVFKKITVLLIFS